MHMADALISAAVGGTMLTVSTGVAGYSIKKLQSDLDEKKIPLMGVMGAFVFAAQMINFTIPGTGSSGHIGGGILLAILLGPHAGFLTMASILLIQALFFGDGGLLAFGCNLFNLGFFTCYIAYPYIYKAVTKKSMTTKRIFWATLIATIIGLQLGSFAVVLQTLFSGKTELPFGTFILFMQPIHLAIGIVEGLVTSAVVSFLWKARPEILQEARVESTKKSFKNVIIAFVLATLLVGGVFSWYASSDPDGLEWSITQTAGVDELENPESQLHETLSEIQGSTAIMPDYGFRTTEDAEETQSEGAVNVGTSVAGITGGVLTLVFTAIIGFVLFLIKRKRKTA